MQTRAMMASSLQGRSLILLTLFTLVGAGVMAAAEGEVSDNKGDGQDDNGCSQVCQCHYMDDNLSAHCVRMNLVKVPTDLPLNVTILDLSMNNITVLKADTFKIAYPLLYRLDLRMNGLTDIKLGVWWGMGHLGELGLDHNELMTLGSGVFSDLSSLTVLSMNSNKIASIENGTFEGLVLKHLNLHDNNPLQLFEAGLFTGAQVETLSLDRCALTDIHVDSFMPLADSLKNIFWSHNLRPLHLPARLLQGLDLATLWLSDNKMTDLNFLAHTKALHLDLSNNPIGDVDLGVYLAMEHVEFFNLSQSQLKRIQISGGRIMFNLQELDISDNFLRSIEGTLFQRMPSLTRLDVSGNQLHYIGASLHLILYQLEFWDLTGNRLLCDCRLEWFRRWASIQNKTHLLGAVCGLPRLEPVVGAPEFTCAPPTILRISSDAVEHTWHLQCDAEGWPTPRITWSYNISRHLAVRVDERWIAFHGHPFRNSSMLIISDLMGPGGGGGSNSHTGEGDMGGAGLVDHRPIEYCFHFVCAAFNSEGHDRTEYVHCAERRPLLPPPPEGGVLGYLDTEHTLDGGDAAGAGGGENKRRTSHPSGDPHHQNASDVFAARHSATGGLPPHPGVHAGTLPGVSVSVGLSSAALVCLILLGLLAAVLYSRRRGDRLLPRGNHHHHPGWGEQPDGGPGEGLTDSTKCLVEHNEGAEKGATFSMDTV